MRPQLNSGTLGRQHAEKCAHRENAVGLWERLGLGQKRPQRDWVGLVEGDATFERDTGEVVVWRFPDGDGVGIYFFSLKPDLPRERDLPAFLSKTRDHVTAAGVVLVECGIVPIGAIPAVRQIVKVRQRPSGMTYLGSITLPFKKFSYVLKVQCEERGVTGMREAVLLDEGLAAGTVQTFPDSPNPIRGDWDPDADRHDARFPDHPISRVRRHLRSIISSCVVDEALIRHPLFQLPAIEP